MFCRGRQSRLSKYREINKKIATLKKPKNISIRPVLIYEGELSESVVKGDFFDKIIEASRRKQRGILDCKEFCQFFDSLANPAAPLGRDLRFAPTSSGECARCSVHFEGTVGAQLGAQLGTSIGLLVCKQFYV